MKSSLKAFFFVGWVLPFAYGLYLLARGFESMRPDLVGHVGRYWIHFGHAATAFFIFGAWFFTAALIWVYCFLAKTKTEQGGAANPLQPSASGDC